MDERTSDLWFCHQLGSRGYRPFNRMIVEKLGEVEFVSYPFPENDCVFILARTTPGDQTTMEKFKFEKGELVQQ